MYKAVQVLVLSMKAETVATLTIHTHVDGQEPMP
jgi:hypothetical protein